jgi:hypothetical protein
MLFEERRKWGDMYIHRRSDLDPDIFHNVLLALFRNRAIIADLKDH